MITYQNDNMPERGTFVTRLGGSNIEVAFNIYTDHRAVCTFSYMARSYIFEMGCWKGTKPFNDFIRKFHAANNNPVEYGTTLENDIVDATFDQQVSIVRKAVRDCFTYLDQLLHTQDRAIVDYAMWYRERYGKELNTYSDYIQVVTCNCIVHSEFIAPNIAWMVVPFGDLNYTPQYSWKL